MWSASVLDYIQSCLAVCCAVGWIRKGEDRGWVDSREEQS